MNVQDAFRTEPQQAASRRRRENSAVASPELIEFFNNAAQSDCVVLFMRALSAFHMLRHPQDFELINAQFEETEEERSLATVQKAIQMLPDSTCGHLGIAWHAC